jgi:pimeloyl-ACP methyl ester carboxylesterase
VPNELSALVEAAAEAVDLLGITPVQSLHGAVARRAFGAQGAAAAPARVLHDGIATAVYTSLRAATAAAGGAAATAVRAVSDDEDVRPLSRSRGGRIAMSAINAFIGDRLEERGSDLAIPMSLRRRGEDLPCTPAALRRAHPRATGRIAVFLHGLLETEEWWRRGGARRTGHDGRPFGLRLRRELGITPVDVRYNTGVHVSHNGRRLAALLESLVEAWPREVEEVALVGHSMGGLVARAACHAAASAGHTWPRRARHLVTLGTPHTGAPLEKAVHVAAWALRTVPEARPVADVLDLRSAGIRDLRFGYLRDEDWLDEDPAALLADRSSPVALLDGCTHTFITATVTRDPRHPLGRVAGDLLVRTDSAAGRHRVRAIPLPEGCVVHVGGLHHFDLLDHPLVYEQLHRVLAGATPEAG